MRVVITGGGTGGHIYPALEVGFELRRRGAELLYFGSHRGQEGKICENLGIPFQGFGSAPLYSLKQLRGWKSLAALAKATQRAKKYLHSACPEIVFSTGGYSAAPVMQAAKSLKIPYVIHEANSVPGRSNRMFAESAAGFTCVFSVTQGIVAKAIRTGQPIRAQLREAASQPASNPDRIFCVGGSQGSQFLNQVFPQAASLDQTGRGYLLATGKGNYDQISKSDNPTNLTIKPFLETEEMVEAYRKAKVVVARSGGTLAELAMFGIPSVLIPLPSAADDHQTKNAEEFVHFGGAKLLRQSVADAKTLSEAILGWIENPQEYAKAERALREWDRPNATSDVADLVMRSVAK